MFLNNRKKYRKKTRFDLTLLLTKEAIKPTLTSGDVEIISLQILTTPSRVRCSNCRDHNLVLISSNVTYRISLIPIFLRMWATGRCKVWSANPSEKPEITPWFKRDSCCSVFNLRCCVVPSVFNSSFFVFLFYGVVSLFSTYEYEYPVGLFHLYLT